MGNPLSAARIYLLMQNKAHGDHPMMRVNMKAAWTERAHTHAHVCCRYIVCLLRSAPRSQVHGHAIWSSGRHDIAMLDAGRCAKRASTEQDAMLAYVALFTHG